MFFIFRVRFTLIILLLCFSLPVLFQQPSFAETKIVINKGTNQLAFFKDGYLIDVFPVATGRLPHFTPEGTWQVVVKLVYPSWRNPKGGPVIPGGVPANPLGPRWLGLNARGTGGSSYGIHGNNNPSSIGTYASSGCVRMRNEDILWLYERVPLNTMVEIINRKEDLHSWKRFSRATVNGAPVQFAPHLGPLQAGEKTYLPVRPAAAALGYRMFWDESTNTLLLACIDREVWLTVGSRRVKVNNTVVAAEEAPFLFENLTFVPDDYFQRFLGAEVTREEGNGTIALKAPVNPGGGRLVKYHLSVKVNGKPLALPEALTPLTDGEKLLVPIRPVCGAAGAAVNWNETAQSFEINLMGKRAFIPLNGSPALVNGAVAETPAAVFTLNGNSYIDIQFLEDAFGFAAELDDRNRNLDISTYNNVSMMFTNPFRLLRDNCR
ncbi:MAG: L,D-transpeptidase family protein [Firmicutes bacterium]|nr:L,D-transpeptidase family protein [Bacillota bacterium]